MAVVPFPMDLPPQGPNAGNPWELRSLSARNGPSPLDGVATSLERPGAHFALRLPYDNLATARRARLQTFGMANRGGANRFHVPVFGWTRRGSFPATELLTNPYFTSTTGWAVNSSASLTAADGILRATRTQNNASGQVLSPSSGATVVQYAPYCARALWSAANYTPVLDARIGSTQYAADYVSGSTGGLGLRTAAGVVLSTTAFFGSGDFVTNNIAGHYSEIAYASLARCALVDNGPNHLLRASEINNAAWTKGGGAITANLSTAPDGTGTGDAFTEDGSAGSHGYSQSGSRTSAATDLCGFGYFRRATGTRNVALYVGNDFSDYGRAVFDLGGGTVAAVGTAGAATNARAFITPAGNGWYFCAVVARVPAAATILCIVNSASGTSDSYTGDGTSIVSAWRVGATVSSVPTRGAETVASALQTGTSQTGGALYLKGLPASTNGLLLQGDPAEIIIGTTSQLVRTRGALNSDAAGLGYWQFEPPLRVSPADNAAVIIQNPLCKMMMENNVAGWTDRLGGFSDLEFAAVEDTYPS